jgi:hypothetical protein
MGTALLSVVAGAIQSPAVATAQKRRVKQGELNGAIQSHALWLVDMSKGKRAVFNECDLSGRRIASSICSDLIYDRHRRVLVIGGIED